MLKPIIRETSGADPLDLSTQFKIRTTIDYRKGTVKARFVLRKDRIESIQETTVYYNNLPIDFSVNHDSIHCNVVNKILKYEFESYITRTTCKTIKYSNNC